MESLHGWDNQSQLLHGPTLRFGREPWEGQSEPAAAWADLEVWAGEDEGEEP